MRSLLRLVLIELQLLSLAHGVERCLEQESPIDVPGNGFGRR